MSNLWIITRREDGDGFNANPVTEEKLADVLPMFANQEHWIADGRESLERE